MTKPLCQQTKRTRQILTFHFVVNVRENLSCFEASFGIDFSVCTSRCGFAYCKLKENKKNRCLFSVPCGLGSTRIATGGV